MVSPSWTGHRHPAPDRSHAVNRLGELEPRPVHRDRQDLHVAAGDRKRVARVQERTVIDQVCRVRAAGHIAVDGNVHAAGDLHGRAADPEPVAWPRDEVGGQAQGGPQGIRVNAVSLAMTQTPHTTPLLQDPEGPAASIAARAPLGRWGEPQDVAHAILFLSSDESSHVSGANIPVDGGAAVVG